MGQSYWAMRRAELRRELVRLDDEHGIERILRELKGIYKQRADRRKNGEFLYRKIEKALRETQERLGYHW